MHLKGGDGLTNIQEVSKESYRQASNTDKNKEAEEVAVVRDSKREQGFNLNQKNIENEENRNNNYKINNEKPKKKKSFC